MPRSRLHPELSQILGHGPNFGQAPAELCLLHARRAMPVARPSSSPSSHHFWSNLGRYGAALFGVAVGAAGFAIVFRQAIGLVFRGLYGGKSDVLSAFQGLPWYTRLILPICGGSLAGLLGAWAAKLKGGQGVGEVMEAVTLGRGRISLRLTLVKALGSWSAIVTGDPSCFASTARAVR